MFISMCRCVLCVYVYEGAHLNEHKSKELILGKLFKGGKA